MALVPKPKVVVIDTGPLIMGESLEALGDQLVTVEGVLNEVRDRRARAQLAKIDASIIVRSPASWAVRAVMDAARETGDLPAMSSVDIQVLSMALHVAVEEGEVADPRTAGASDGGKDEVEIPTGRTEIVIPKTSSRGWGSSEGDAVAAPSVETAVGGSFPSIPSKDMSKVFAAEAPSVSSRAEEHVRRSFTEEEGAELLTSDDEEEEEEEGEEEKERRWLEEEAEKREEEVGRSKDLEAERQGFVGPKTLARLGKDGAAAMAGWGGSIPKGTGITKAEEKPPVCGCVTADYAMQNVLLKLGVPLFTIGGRRVKGIRRWVLKCTACFAITPQTGRLFCPTCGNASLSRLACTVKPNGKTVYHYSRKFFPRTRGLRYSIPKPKPGKKGGGSQKYLVAEDQLLSGKWAQRAKQRSKKEPLISSPGAGWGGGWTGPSSSKVKGPTDLLDVRGKADIVPGVPKGRNPNAYKGRSRRGQKKSKRPGAFTREHW